MLLIPILWGCYQFNNPVDPGSANYQGYPAVPGWLDGWTYRKHLQLGNSSGTTATDYVVRIVVHYGSGSDSEADVYINSHSRTDFGDIRFTSSDSETVFDYWIMRKADGATATFWVRVPSISASDGVGLFCYYGNAAATSQSSGENTFQFFDDFSDGTFDSSKWRGDTGLWYISGGVAWCSDYPSVICGYETYDDAEVLAQLKFEARTDGFIGLRGNYNAGEPPYQDSRYDLFFDSDNSQLDQLYASLRSIQGGTTYTLTSGDYFSSYSHDFFLARIGAVGNKLTGGGSTTDETVTLLKSDPSPVRNEGFISLGTEYTNPSTMYVDWVAVRPLIDPEPTYDGGGSEEQ